MVFIPQQTRYDSHHPMYDLFPSIFLSPRVEQLHVMSHMLNVLVLSNFDPAQRESV